MFKHLSNLAYQRNWKQAIGFYLVYLFGLSFLSGVIGAAASVLVAKLGFQGSFAQGFELGMTIGTAVAALSSWLIAFMILIQKKLLANPFFLILAVLSGPLGYLGGSLLGLIPLAYLTTRQIRSEFGSADHHKATKPNSGADVA